MITELGHFGVILAFTIATIAILVKEISFRCLGVILMLLIIAQISMIWGFYMKDFSVLIIKENSNYFAHAGNIMLIFTTIMAGVLYKIKPNINIIRAISIIIAITIGILLIEYNPFTRAI